MAFDLRYLGHSAFEINNNENYILIDPFLALFPKYNWRNLNIKEIFVTHGHSDHLGSAIEIAKAKEARITAIYELANYCADRGAFINPVGLGGWVDYDYCKAIFLPAFHSSSTPDGQYAGCPCSILFEINGVRIFHAGDTCLNQEMKIISEMNKPDIAILPIGGHFTMDIRSAVKAADWLGAEVVIPMHYNTFPPIEQDPVIFSNFVKQLDHSIDVVIMNPGEVYKPDLKKE